MCQLLFEVFMNSGTKFRYWRRLALVVWRLGDVHVVHADNGLRICGCGSGRPGRLGCGKWDGFGWRRPDYAHVGVCIRQLTDRLLGVAGGMVHHAVMC